MSRNLEKQIQSGRTQWFAFLLLFTLVSACSSHGTRVPAGDPEAQFYNETHDENGKLRPQYEGVWQHFQSLSEEEKNDFVAKSKIDFKNDNALSPLPRLLTEDESSFLNAGVEQRSRALVAFLKDHYSGQKSYLDEVIPKEVIDRIIRRSGEEGFEGLIDPERIAFPYGPDIIRDKQGVWRVLEDNPGFIGGMGDLRQARESVLKRIPEYQKLLKLKDKPEDYYKEVGRRYRASRGKGRAVVYMIPPYADNEDLRLKKLYAEQGLQIVTPNSAAKLVSTDKGLYVEEKKGGVVSRYRVGYLVLNGEHAWVDTDHPATRTRNMYGDISYWLNSDPPQKPEVNEKLRVLMDEFEATGKIDEQKYLDTFKEANIMPYMKYPDRRAQRIKGFVDLWSKGAFEMNYTPGVDFIGDKEFTQYVEELVRFYLDEEPLLKNVPTYDFAVMRGRRLVLDQKLFNKVADDRANFVIKQVDGRGGEGIWVGAKLTETEWKKGLAAVKAHPQKFQVQEYKHLSVVGDLIVDLRMISIVDAKGTYVSRTPWGRGLPLKGNGKVNISDEGLEVAIAVVKSRQPCSRHLVDLHQ